jgi:CPA2 family monovalent cation:H+ antiporter-2
VESVAQPIQSILLMVFFLSIGLLIDLNYMWDNLVLVLGLWFFVSVFKTALNTFILQLMGEQPQRAFMTSLSLAQVGEFSFVLGATALSHNVITPDLHRLVVAITVVSLVTSPLWMHTVRRLHEQGTLTHRTPMALLRVVYVREWRLTLKMTAGLFQWFEGKFIRVKALYWRWKHSRSKDPALEAEILPPDAAFEAEDGTAEAPIDDETGETGERPGNA